ncbi:DcaP family trimeric outer membrane transporter [Teredinibacter haidensis]|uniref:DcaP family trimeric outer membrane transporter n=1 Tax=Teredinibacter haidensis TaxID=2731755 RepID=UPI000948C66C|nr:DcaP family trimeric outer membrane transporter [Teredinibacter haidensis]
MKAITKAVLTSGLAAASLCAATGTQAIELGTYDNTTVKLGGYIKLDAISSTYSDGTLAAGNLGRDFYVPSLTPVGGESANSTMDIHAKQSRFNIGTTTSLDGHTLKTFVEMDFHATPNGNERVSNSYTPRMRHAFLTYDNWLFGQTWSTFQNVGALPETVDFIGNTDFGIFVRQAQVRYTAGNFQFSVENPETTITPFGGGTRIVTDQNALPDFVGRYNYSSDNLAFSAAVLARQLAYNDTVNDSSTSSLGLSLSGKYKIGKDDIRFGLNSGSGMGRYIGLNVANGAVMTASGDLETIDSTAYYLAYRHLWNEKWRSNISYSAITVDNDTDLTGTAVTDSTDSLRVNLFHSPVPNLSLGGELAFANRELESGVDGSMTRVQFSAKLAF